MHKAVLALDEDGQVALSHDLGAMTNGANVANNTSRVVPAEYLEVVLRRT